MLELKKARLVEQLNRTREAAGIVAQVIVQEDLRQTLAIIADHVQQVLRCDAVTIYSYDEDQQRFDEWVVVGANQESARPPARRKPDSSLDTVLNGNRLYEFAEEDAHRHQLLAGKFVTAEKIRAAFAIRLEAGDCRVGVLFVNFRSRHRFSTNEIETIRLFANQAAVAIRNAQLHDKTKKRADALSGLYEAGQAITSTLTLAETLQRVAEQTLNVVGRCESEGCFSHVALLNKNKDRLHFIAASTPEILNALTQGVKEINLRNGDRIGIAGRAVTEGRSQVVADTTRHADYITLRPQTHSQLSVPLKFNDQVTGVLSIEHPRLGAFTDEHRHNVELLAAQAAVAIQNAQRHEDLKEIKGLVGTRTATDWIRMVSTAWGHSVRREASVARNYLELVQQDSSANDVSQMQADLAKLALVIERLKDIPIIAPLAVDDTTVSVQINQTLKQHVERLWQREPYRSVELNWELCATLDEVASSRVSPAWLRCALDILLDNAIDAMNAIGSTVKRIIISTALSVNAIEIRISDSGPGIPVGIQPQLFVAPIDKPIGSRGAGLGLMLARNIIQTYGGNLLVGQTGPSGTLMVISLPVESRA